jgi:hypothetical protein
MGREVDEAFRRSGTERVRSLRFGHTPSRSYRLRSDGWALSTEPRHRDIPALTDVNATTPGLGLYLDDIRGVVGGEILRFATVVSTVSIRTHRRR